MKQTIPKLKKKLDQIFSLYIRLKNSNDFGVATCFTCGKLDSYKRLQNGHFQSRKFLATRFDEENCQVQCSGCNIFRYGEQYKFAVNLNAKYGEGTAEELQRKARQTIKISRTDYEDYIGYYKRLVDNLKKEKGIA
tara:strand:+ start:2761 stop:3168 length:408 start_codon:yes stop_codon:yes gene_type:complete